MTVIDPVCKMELGEKEAKFRSEYKGKTYYFCALSDRLPMNNPLLEMDNVLLTPHIAFLSEEALDECTYMSIENVEMFIKGKPQNVVNPEVLTGRGGQQINENSNSGP